MFNRKKNREESSITDIQRLKQEIRAELARIHGGAVDEPQPAPEPVESLVEGPPQDQLLAQTDPSTFVSARRTTTISASPLIQQTALGQIVAGAAQPTNGATHRADDSPLGAFRHLVERFEVAAARIESQVDKLERLNARPPTGPSPDQRAEEPHFDPNGPPVQVALAGVPNFQALMDVQRALSAIPAVQEAPVSEFEQGDASLQVSLSEGITLSQIMGGLSESCGHPLLVEESRPEAARLRLRFIPQPGPRSELVNPAPATNA